MMDNPVSSSEPRWTWRMPGMGALNDRCWFAGGNLLVTQLRNQTQKYLLEMLILTLLGVYIVRSYYGSSRRSGSRAAADELSERRICEYKPEPIVPDLSVIEQEILSRVPVVDRPERGGRELRLDDGGLYLDMASFNFQGLTNLEEINKVAVEALRKYGVGTCGPRGFYGTMDVHLNLESRITEIFETEGTILYSQALSAITSTLYAFIRKGDFVVADEMVGFGHQKGFHTALNCGSLHFFAHNDMEDLEKQLAYVHDKCKRSRPNARKFLLVEAIYRNTGEVSPLDKIVALKDKYDFFFFVDESISFGVLGETGVGALQRWGIHPSRVDLILGSFSATFASSGGFATGKKILIDYLHLNGKAYTFSASSPSLLISAADYAISFFQQRASSLCGTLRRNCALMHSLLQPLSSFALISESIESPVIHITPRAFARSEDIQLSEKILHHEKILSDIVTACKEDGVLFALSRYDRSHELTPIAPSIRITVSAAHTESDLVKASDIIKKHLSLYYPAFELPDTREVPEGPWRAYTPELATAAT